MFQTDILDDTGLRDGHEAAASATATTATPDERVDCGELFFQRCLWCGTPAHRRSFCRACGSMAFKRERSEGFGVVVRRHGHVPHNTWIVAMNEGFHLVCQATGTAPVAIGSRVSVVQAAVPRGRGLPVVEPTRPPTAGRWW